MWCLNKWLTPMRKPDEGDGKPLQCHVIMTMIDHEKLTPSAKYLINASMARSTSLFSLRPAEFWWMTCEQMTDS